jgi:uncharacterized membrane protein SirB2
MKNKTVTYTDSRQSMWETWFVASFIIVIAYIFVGTMEGSQEMFPNWYIFTIIAMFNFILCIHRGMRKY